MPILTETFEGTPGGMNLALPAQELDNTEARYIQDALVDYPGFTRRRGPVKGATGVAVSTRKGTGLVLALNPAGKDRYAVLNGDNANGYFSTLSDDRTTYSVDLTWPHPLPTNPAVAGQSYRIVDAKPALNGGTWVGVSSTYDSNSPNQGLALWMGANKANWTTGAILNVARGSATVTGSGFNANVVPGMWLFANTDEGYASTLVGLVKTVNSDTSITLREVSPYALTSKIGTFQALRGFAPKVVTGQITADTASTQVTGGSTKFLAQKLNVGTWQLYRASDMAFIGKVASVQSEIALTLTANAAISISSSRYVAIRADSDWGIPTTANTNKVGWLTATYAGRQWYANNGGQLEKTSRVWFSDTGDPEAVDLADFDGDWDTISNTASVDEPIRNILSSNTGLLVWKENETFIITGNSPNSFAPKKLEDDGTLSGMSVQPFGGGAIWAGREGIHYFDGIQVQNLTNAKLGDYWKSAIRTFDPLTYRMWSMMNRDHYFLFIEDWDPPVPVVKGTVASTPTRLTVVVNMNSRAITLLTNVHIRGAVTLPAEAGKNSWYLVNGRLTGGPSDVAYIADAEALFTEEGLDPLILDGGPAGPDFYFESKKYDAGDSTRLKKFKQLMLHYLVQGGNIKVDTVVGLNNLGKTLTGFFPPSVFTWDSLASSVSTWNGVVQQFATWGQLIEGVFKPKRLKFQKGSQHLSFRLYQSTNAITRLRIGPFHIGYKMKRPGRI